MKRKLVATAAILAATVFLAGNAKAKPVIGLDMTGSGGPYTYSDLWTNLTDTGLSSGYMTGLTIPPTPAYTTTFTYQARIGALTNGGSVVTPAGLNSSNQLTLTLAAPETVTAEGRYTDGLGRVHEFANFSSGPNPSALANVYADKSGAPANPNVVSGYTAGVNVLSAHVWNITSSFDEILTGSGAGTGTGSFSAAFLINTANSAYIDLSNLRNRLFDIESTGTTNIPSFYSPTTMWNGTPTSTGTKLKVDSSESFSAVPEPSTLLLTGSGLLGFAGYGFARRKKG